MKTRLTALILILSLLLLAGCAASSTTPAADTAESTGTSTTTSQTGTDVQDSAQSESKVQTQTPAQSGTQTTTGALTREDAISVALNAASLTQDDIIHIWAEYEIDDGVPEYEVEFRTADTEYDYTIHAETGEILSWDQEVEHAEQMTAPTGTDAPPLTEAEAIVIALTDAELDEADVTNLHVEYDADDGDYEVEFYYDKMEYTYEINAKTGTIQDYEIDD